MARPSMFFSIATMLFLVAALATIGLCAATSSRRCAPSASAAPPPCRCRCRR
ncbi:MAG: hypothetical protein U1E76_03100 [Planctomycetota bacterium]